MSFFHLKLLIAVLALFCSFCVKAPSPPRFQLPPCGLLAPNSSWHIDHLTENTKNLTVFRLSFLTNNSVSFKFTTNSSDKDDAPMLAFILLMSSNESSMEPGFTEHMGPGRRRAGFKCSREQFTISKVTSLNPLQICDPFSQPIEDPTKCSLEEDPHDSDEAEDLSLEYEADAAELYASQAVEKAPTQAVEKAPRLPPLKLPPSSNEAVTVFVGYIISGEASINVKPTMNYSTPPPPLPTEDHGKPTNHISVVVWVIVGVSMMGLLMGLLILILFIKKRRGRPSLVISRPPAGGHGPPPSAPPRRVPFSHRDFLESSETPMMRGALPLSPPYEDGFQFSGTPSWFKQPNPR